MGIAAGDFDNDGDEDLFVTNLVGESHALYVNDGHANFEDCAPAPGLSPRRHRSPASARAGSITITMAGSICSSPTAR